MSDSSKDTWLDGQLRDVPVPEDLQPRLRGVSDWADEHIDASLGDVPVLERLAMTLTGIVDDERVDRALCDIVLPRGLEDRLRRIPWRVSRRNRARRTFTAAAFWLTISASYVIAMFGLARSAYQVPEVSRTLVLLEHDTIELELSADVVQGVTFDFGQDSPDVQYISAQQQLNIPLSEFGVPAREGAVESWLAPLRSAGGPLVDVNLLRWAGTLVGSQPDGVDDGLPELTQVVGIDPRGIQPPLVPGYDRVFLFNHGVHPVVVLADNEDLSTSTAPLSTSTESFDLARRRIHEGRRPDPRTIRVEDFLAAMDYRFPPPPAGQALAIRTAAGPAVFGSDHAQLLQVGVQARLGDVDAGGSGFVGGAAFPVDTRYVTIAVDMSASMGWQFRWERTRSALLRFVRHLGPRDRLSLVLFNDTAHVLAEDLGREHGEQLRQTLEALKTDGGTNFADGLSRAAAVALRAPVASGVERRLVVLTDGAAGLSPERAEPLATMLADVANRGVRIGFVDLGLQDEVQTVLNRLAAATDGELRRARTADGILWTLVELHSGASSVVASEARLEVQFNPQVVAAYRLIGHAPAAAGTVSLAAESELRLGESATLLYEVWFHPQAGNDVATVHLSWRDPLTGRSHSARSQRISRLQFAKSFMESSLSLQSAAIAAETAEVLQQSYFAAARPHPLEEVHELAYLAHPRLLERRRFSQLVKFVERMRHLRPDSTHRLPKSP